MNQIKHMPTTADSSFVYGMTDAAKMLGITEKLLYGILGRSDKYHTFKIPKKDGTYRTIDSPCDGLKMVQRKLAEVLADKWTPSACSFGFLKGKSIVDNARTHINQKWILNIDLEDFFPSITIKQIESVLVSPPFNLNQATAGIIAQIACNGSFLPQGSPSSPILSDIVASPLDSKLNAIALESNCRYSRYADDITFSTSQESFPPEIARIASGKVVIGQAIGDTIDSLGFRINQNKISAADNAHHQEVTGIVVNEKVNIRRKYISQLRSILYNCSKYGIYPQAIQYIHKHRYRILESVFDRIDDVAYIEWWFSMVLRGKTEYIRMVKGASSPTFFMIAARYNVVFGPTFDIPPMTQRQSN